MVGMAPLSRRALLQGLSAGTGLGWIGCGSSAGSEVQVDAAVADAGIPQDALDEESEVDYPFPYVDGMSFPSSSDADVEACGLSAFIWDVSYCEPVDMPKGPVNCVRTFMGCSKGLADALEKVAKLPNVFVATHGSEIAQAWSDKRVCVFLQLQGADSLVEDFANLDYFYDRGLRILQLTHTYGNALASSFADKASTGLTPLGVQAIELMNAKNVIVDISHASPLTCADVFETSKKPVVLTHGAAHSLCKSARCSPDEVIKGVADSGGVFGIFMMSCWLTDAPVPTVEHLVAQVRHVINTGGIDAVGISNDYTLAGEEQAAALGNDNAKAVEAYYTWWQQMAELGLEGFDQLVQHVVIPELNNVYRMSLIDKALKAAGHSCAEREKIMGGNFRRFLTQELG